jgi:hypothetical protein
MRILLLFIEWKEARIVLAYILEYKHASNYEVSIRDMRSRRKGSIEE